MVMDIQRFSIHDGPGIRTTVFLKGCHMSCLWCHNPESQYAKPQLMFYEAQCIGCGRCVKKCIRYTFKKKTRPNTQNHVLYEPDLKICRDCEQMRSCAENCPSEALRLCGRTMTVQEVMTEIEKDVDCYIDGGGVTFSGGEPLLQSAFLKEILPKCAEKKISVCLDTTLEVMWEKIEPLLPYVGLFLVDVKILNPEKASVYQGICYKNMPKNLKRLSDLNIPVIIRVPLAKGINDTPEEIERRETLLKSLTNIIRIDSFYVSNHGASKYKALQKEMMWKASVADEKSDQLDIGGNVQAIGTKTDGSRWKVGVQSPDDTESMIGAYEAADEAVITSGAYERYFEKDGKTYHHIIDPATGKPSEKDLKSVTIISKNGTLSDTLSTTLFVMGKDKAISYWKEHSKEFNMILVDENNKVYISQGIKDHFSSDSDFTVIKK